MFEFRELKTR